MRLRDRIGLGSARAKPTWFTATRYSFIAALLVFIALRVVLLAVERGVAVAGPPFLTDDPQPLDPGHSELYIFGTNDEAPVGESVLRPAIEYNYGFAPNAHAHIAVPFACYSPPTEQKLCGLGDTEVG